MVRDKGSAFAATSANDVDSETAKFCAITGKLFLLQLERLILV